MKRRRKKKRRRRKKMTRGKSEQEVWGAALHWVRGNLSAHPLSRFQCSLEELLGYRECDLG